MQLYSGQVWPDGQPQQMAEWACETWYHTGNTYNDPTIFGDGTGPGQPALDTFIQSYNPGDPPDPP